MKFLSAPIYILFVCSAMQAQTTANQLLASAWDDYTVQLHREQQAYLQNSDFNLPLLRKLEVRTETRDLDLKQQEYALRLGTNSFGMKRSQSAIYGSMKEMTEADRQLLVREALLNRYELLLDVHFNQQILALLERQRLILLDKKSVYSQQLSLGLKQDLDDFFRTEDDLLQLERKIFEVKSANAGYRLRLKIFTEKEDSLAVPSLVSLAEIRQVADMVAQGNVLESPLLLRRQSQAEMAIQEEELEKMEGRKLINYLQFRYTGNGNDVLEDRFSIGAGFNLPWPNSSKLKEQELHLETLEAQAKVQSERQSIERATSLKINELLHFFEQRDFLKKQTDALRERYDPQRLHDSGLENPETLLRVQESIARLDLELASVEKDIYQAYLSLMGETGLLIAEPARNYLSAGLELIAR